MPAGYLSRRLLGLNRALPVPFLNLPYLWRRKASFVHSALKSTFHIICRQQNRRAFAASEVEVSARLGLERMASPAELSWQSVGAARTALSAEEAIPVRVVSYNLLAQAYVKSALFPHSPPACLKARGRLAARLKLLRAFDADFICVQEMDDFDKSYKSFMAQLGYDYVYAKRPSRKKDGSGIFFQAERFKLLKHQYVDFNDLAQTRSGNSCQPATSPGADSKRRRACWTRSNEWDRRIDSLAERSPGAHSPARQKAGEEPAKPDATDPAVRFQRDCVGALAAFSLTESPHVALIVACTHLYWDPEWPDVKLGQAKYLLKCLVSFRGSLQWQHPQMSPVPMIVCGDFNSQPLDPVCNFLISGSGPENSSSSRNTPEVSGEGEHVNEARSAAGTTSESPAHERPVKRLAVETGCAGTEAEVLRRELEALQVAPVSLQDVYCISSAEPACTNFTPGFTGAIDHIYFSQTDGIRATAVVNLPARDDPSVKGGLPNEFHPSDHVPIGAEFLLLK